MAVCLLCSVGQSRRTLRSVERTNQLVEVISGHDRRRQLGKNVVGAVDGRTDHECRDRKPGSRGGTLYSLSFSW